ncbi:MAG: lipoate--protein ligase [Clostridiales bacterium]|nr:lipoate--protein ligase [Clostridiales bacterium]
MLSELLIFETFDADPYRNLAVEAALMEALHPGQCLLYLWQNDRTVVIGRNQDAERECRIALLEQEDGRLARRPSGGGAVYHDLGNLNFTFLVAERDYDPEQQLSVLLGAVRAAGVQAVQSGRNDLLAGGRKISGSAFLRRDGRHCHHGTLLVSVDLDRLTRYLDVQPDKLQAKGVASVRARVANLTEFCPGLTTDRMRALLKESAEQVFGLPAQAPPGGMPDPAAVAIHAARFASAEWRLGRRFPAQRELHRRFDWGDIRLLLALEGGRIAQAAAFSDALEADFIAELPAALTGPAGDPVSTLRTLAGDHPLRRRMADDIAALLAEAL